MTGCSVTLGVLEVRPTPPSADEVPLRFVSAVRVGLSCTFGTSRISETKGTEPRCHSFGLPHRPRMLQQWPVTPDSTKIDARFLQARTRLHTANTGRWLH